MKQREKCSGRGFDSRQVHHKTHWARRKIHRWTLRLSVFYNGPAMVSTGQQVNKWTARECETRRVGGTRP